MLYDLGLLSFFQQSPKFSKSSIPRCPERDSLVLIHGMVPHPSVLQDVLSGSESLVSCYGFVLESFRTSKFFLEISHQREVKFLLHIVVDLMFFLFGSFVLIYDLKFLSMTVSCWWETHAPNTWRVNPNSSRYIFAWYCYLLDIGGLESCRNFTLCLLSSISLQG